MIVGIGNDITRIDRIENSINRFGERFLNRVFTPTEQQKAQRRTETRHMRTGTYAKRFAAKEACAKALGTGFREGVFMRDMGVVNLPSGKPTLHLTGGAKAALQKLIPEGMVAQIDLTMTDDYPHAQAVVIISAVAMQ
ncbi:MAG: holo-ACP synthase [Alphaproteobacteria bacterium]|nr:holo-ACP synthase [Alphaproteobacteria bacterium]